jgi:hypothetical protein
MLNKKYGIALLFVAWFVSNSGAQMTPSLTVVNKPDSTLEIIPADNAHSSALPASLIGQLASLPPGSFILKNRTNKAITALVAEWKFLDANGKSQQHKLTTDAYYLPIDWTVVRPLGLLLVTPSGYAAEEQFQRLASSGALDPLPRAAGIKAANEPPFVSIVISLDSVIFEDGGIWGPDNRKYYMTLLTRRSVLEGLSAEFKDAKTAGEDFKRHLEKIRQEAPRAKDQRASHRRDYAGLLQRNPDPEALFKKLEAQAPLPDFHHVGGETQ